MERTWRGGRGHIVSSSTDSDEESGAVKCSSSRFLHTVGPGDEGLKAKTVENGRKTSSNANLTTCRHCSTETRCQNQFSLHVKTASTDLWGGIAGGEAG